MSNLSNIIKKERFFLEFEKKSWIVDCFKENNYPLEIAEIELKKRRRRIKSSILFIKRNYWYLKITQI